jgi:hypothetical protein
LSELYPPLPSELVTFVEGGVSLLVGTCSAELVPDCVRAVGLRVSADACSLTVLVPAATGATSIANLRTNPKLAVTMSHIASHRTMQVKGTVVAIREGTEDDRALATTYRGRFAESLAFVGQHLAITQRLSIWPCHAIDVEIAIVFAQTPGPSAGVKMPVASGGL